ncbi:uncharacterized protein LAJ45_05807 [Morchella importuna]|uniref:uncharacterized protein n=1 Tax=Morchella importuna TaxID=1174673 RepID=UPI001E8D97BE|nr:uncharacterized protein LAJ45_05807 [Morchella importuna]KAH8150121.1 hypothetical protein LAJ45_05807 [Morchella importuna]
MIPREALLRYICGYLWDFFIDDWLKGRDQLQIFPLQVSFWSDPLAKFRFYSYDSKYLRWCIDYYNARSSQ